jgi:hypothetical protein
MRRPLALAIALPSTLVASLGAHSLAYRLVVADDAHRADSLARSGHGYLAFAPLLVAAALVVVLVGLALRAVGARRGDGRELRLPWLCALVPPLVFVVQEHVERLASTGHFPVAAALEPTFVVGLLLQLPLAVAALALARALVAGAAAVGSALARQPRRAGAAPPTLARPRTVLLAPLSVLALKRAGRAPPAALPA